MNAELHWGIPSPLNSSEYLPLRIDPGSTVNVTLGGPGIEVTGQLVAEGQPPEFDYHFGINYLVARRTGIEPPAWLSDKGFDWKKGWSDAWRNSSEGGAYLQTLHHWFVKPEPNGRFRISGLAPGDYNFSVNLYGATEGCLVHPSSGSSTFLSATANRTSTSAWCRSGRLPLRKLEKWRAISNSTCPPGKVEHFRPPWELCARRFLGDVVQAVRRETRSSRTAR